MNIKALKLREAFKGHYPVLEISPSACFAVEDVSIGELVATLPISKETHKFVV